MVVNARLCLRTLRKRHVREDKHILELGIQYSGMFLMYLIRAPILSEESARKAFIYRRNMQTFHFR